MTYPSKHLIPYFKKAFPFVDKVIYFERENTYLLYSHENKIFTLRWISSNKWEFHWHAGGEIEFDTFEERISTLRSIFEDRIKEAENA